MMLLKVTFVIRWKACISGLIDLVDDRWRRSTGTEAIQVFLCLSALAAACPQGFLISLQVHIADND